MYNKLFTKILDSSIWLEDDTTRLVWFTFLAAMDEDGFAQFASIANLAHRARVSGEACSAAIAVLEGPDANSADPDHEGRRIERVPGGWMILNAAKYREMVTRVIVRDQTRKRVAKHREKGKKVTECNGEVTQGNESVTPSETVAETKAEAVPPPTPTAAKPPAGVREGKASDMIPTSEQSKRLAAIMHRRLTTPWQKNEVAAYKLLGTIPEDDLCALEDYYERYWPPKRGINILRTDLLTLLNNFQGEVGRAHADCAKPKRELFASR